MASDKIDTVVGACIAAALGVIMICSVLIPIVTGQLDLLTSDESAKYGALIGVVVIMTIVGLIISIVRHFNGQAR